MNTPHYLHDGAIMLRCPEPYDLDIIYSWENDTELWTEGSANAPFTRKIIEEYIDNYNPDIYSARQLRLMIVKIDTMETIGAADLYEFDPHNRRAGVGIIIDRRFQRMGYGARAVSYTHLDVYKRQVHDRVMVILSHNDSLIHRPGYLFTEAFVILILFFTQLNHSGSDDKFFTSGHRGKHVERHSRAIRIGVESIIDYGIGTGDAFQAQTMLHLLDAAHGIFYFFNIHAKIHRYGNRRYEVGDIELTYKPSMEVIFACG